MILSEIRQYLTSNRRATLRDLANHFDIEPAAMEGMLDQWVRKGRVIRSDVHTGCCRTCTSCCDRSGMELYEWVH